MYAAIGIVILLVMVFGGFAITGGALGPVMEAIPHEMLIIGGAALGAVVTGNSLHEIKAIGGGFGKVFKGPKHNKQDHVDAIVLCTRLMKILRSDGPVALESHVTDPANSPIFAEFPRILANKPLVALICDTLTLIVVVAAVLGVVKTMGSIDKPPSILGAMIGSALVGTFMGVLLAYGIVAPLAGRLKQVLDQDEMIFQAVKQVIIASLHGWPQPLVVESARSGLGHSFRPGLSELLDALRGR